MLLNRIICDLGKITKSTPHQKWSFPPAYLGRSNKLRASLEFLYVWNLQSTDKLIAHKFAAIVLLFSIVVFLLEISKNHCTICSDLEKPDEARQNHLIGHRKLE